MEYFNLALNIETSDDGRLEIRAQSDTMGEAKTVVALDSGSPMFVASLDRLASGRVDREFLTSFGGTLGEALFAGDVRDLYRESLGQVHRDDEKGLRIRLCVESPAVSALPWELAYDRNRDTFLATSSETPLTRYISLHEPIAELRTAPPISVLVAIPDNSGLDVAMERAIIEDALFDIGPAVRVVILDGRVTRSAISQALLTEKHHIFHFIGHGLFEKDNGFLVLNGEDGSRGDDLIDARSFAGFFRDYPSMKLVVLNACQGATTSSTRPLAGIAPQLVRTGTPAVVAMQYPVADKAALLFAREFYLKLCTGSNRGRIDSAVSHARNRLCMDFGETHAFATPVLYMRSPSGVIFDLDEPNARRGLLASRQDIHRLRAVRQTHESNIEALHHGGVSSPEEIKAEGVQIAAITGRLRNHYYAIAGFLLGTWVLLFASWIGLFNAVQLDSKLEQAFVRYMDNFVETPLDRRVRLILASGDGSGSGSLGKLGSPEWRCRHARLLDALGDAGALVVAFDLYFEDPSSCDQQFADSMRQAAARGTAVVLGAREIERRDGSARPVMAALLRDAVGDSWGILEGDRVSRRLRLAVPLVGRTPLQIEEREAALVPSFSLRTLMHVEAQRRGGGPITATIDRRIDRIRLRDADGVPVRTIPPADPALNMIVSIASRDDLAPAEYHDMLTAAGQPNGLARFEGKVVVVGYATADDPLATGGAGGRSRYGVELQASAISNLLGSFYIKPLSPLAQYLVIFLMGAIGAAIGWRLAPRKAAPARLRPRLTRDDIRPWGLVAAAAGVYALAVFLMYKQYQLIPDISYHIASLLFMYAMTRWVRHGGQPKAVSKAS